MASDMFNKPFTSKLSLSDFNEEIQNFIAEYSCPLCEGILFNSIIDRCGHSFCLSCAESLIKAGQPCPFSNKRLIQTELFPNSIINSTIEKQTVQCSNKDEGCLWKGKLLQREDHLKYECLRAEVYCIYQCGFFSKRDEVNKHQLTCEEKTVECEYCKDEVKLSYLDIHYNNKCKYYPVRCECGKNIPINNMKSHIDSDCEKAVISCSFQAIGCDFHAERRLVKEHLKESNDTHLRAVTSMLVNQSQMIESLNQKIEELERSDNLSKLEIYNLKAFNNKQYEELSNIITSQNSELMRIKHYSTIQFSNYIPDFKYESSEYFNYDTTLREVFDISEEEALITKIADNTGWYGISSKPLKDTFYDLSNTNTNSSSSCLVINLKIINTSNSCIMLGLCFDSKINLPVIGGFYKNIQSNNYMFYCFNNSLYKNGLLLNKPTSYRKCISGDVVSLIVDFIKSEITFKINGVIMQELGIEELSNEDTRQRLKVSIDITDAYDKVIFI